MDLDKATIEINISSKGQRAEKTQNGLALEAQDRLVVEATTTKRYPRQQSKASTINKH